MISPVSMALLKAAYTFCLVVLFLFSLNSLVLSVLYLVNRKKVWNRGIPEMKQDWPLVTIQLPIFNERYMVERLLKAVTALDYPADKLQIQVLDDSTDSTTELVEGLVRRYQRRGINIVMQHRDDRTGYKAGAMQMALGAATGEFVAVFDADFLPKPDWLKKTIPFFQDEKIGFVQTRWGHVNNHYNLITRMAAMALDAEFVIEQTARAGSNLLISFNGTAGIWRVAAIQASGGWQGDTLTEDIDLSYRAQMAGWKYAYIPDVVVMSEVPAQMDALKKQQVRWVKGNFQVSRKLMGKLILSQLNPWQKIMAILQLTMLYIPYPVTVITILLAFPVNLYAPHFMYYFGWTMIGLFGPVFLYTLAQSEFNPSLFRRVILLPALIMLGVGISINCTFGILAGLSKKSGTFERTPKYNITNENGQWTKNYYALSLSPVAGAELLMALYVVLSNLNLTFVHHYAFQYWQLLPAGAYFMVALSSITQSFQRSYARSRQGKPQTTVSSN
jgi:cellulose synthase/poly-beta-1,6-N-acetylglucosamine synthase-like glycosyltransferase